MIRSITLQAWIRPSWISRFFCSFSRSVLYFLPAISYWKSALASKMARSPIVSGRPSMIPSILTPKVSSRRVFL